MSIDRFILASGSPRRKELLGQIGINPEIIPSDIDEKVTTSVPGELVISLSKSKAMDIASKLQESESDYEISAAADHQPLNSGNISHGSSLQNKMTLILGADTVVSVDGHILGKPHSHEEAKEMIRSIQGRTHQVYTGVTIIARDSAGQATIDSFAVKTDVNVYPMTESEIKTYAESAEPMDKAGAYGIQGAFARYIIGIDGDYNNVVGLPVAEVYQRIKKYLNEND
ncbi:Maf family protein [Oribacterium sp. FC2011]|uniref:Maf family protein n=1 Tax=Oribacterium sp. FC2011 TaxID=1408311 RepID=UPI0004E22F58|nr:Maf family protein [Oribacterium sp. FC2011]